VYVTLVHKDDLYARILEAKAKGAFNAGEDDIKTQEWLG